MPTALEAALRDAVAQRLADLALSIDYPTIPEWMREFDRLHEFEAATTDLSTSETIPSHG